MRFIRMVVIALLIIPGPVAAAQRPKIEVNGGVALPTNPESFSKAYNVGFGGGIGLELPVNPAIRFIGRLEYTTFALCRGDYGRFHDIPEGTSIVGGERSITYLSGTVLWHLAPALAIHPYVLGGVGFFRSATDDIIVAGEKRRIESEGVTGIHGGGGVDVGLGPMLNLFFEAVYVVGLTEEQSTSYVPFRAGIAVDLATDL